MTFNDRAIVLARTPWREADKRVILYTREHGKIEAVAIGARKIKSKLAGHLEPLRIVDVMIARGAITNKLAQAQTRQNFIRTTTDPVRLSLLGSVARLIDRGTETWAADIVLYELTQAVLGELETADQNNLWAVYGLGLQHIAEHLGIGPEFSQCVVCGRANELEKFSAAQGGVVCKTCSAADARPFMPDLARRFEFVAAVLQWRGIL